MVAALTSAATAPDISMDWGAVPATRVDRAAIGVEFLFMANSSLP
jgi:hypothetical protein